MTVKFIFKKKQESQKKGNVPYKRLRKIFGIVCHMLPIYLAVVFISYMYTWNTDLDKVLQFSWEIILQGDLNKSIWLVRLVAFVPNVIFYLSYGLPFLTFVFLISKLGADLMKNRSLELFLQKVKVTILWIVFLSLVLEFLFSGSEFTWGGALGESTCHWLISFVSSVGLFFSFLFSLLGFVIWQLDPQMSKIQAIIPVEEKISLDTNPFAKMINRFLISIATEESKEKVARLTAFPTYKQNEVIPTKSWSFF